MNTHSPDVSEGKRIFIKFTFKIPLMNSVTSICFLCFLLYGLPAFSQQVPKYPKEGIYFTYDDFKNGKITVKNYKHHGMGMLNVEKDESGKKFFKSTELWGFVNDEGALYVVHPFKEKDFLRVLLQGEIVYYNTAGIVYEEKDGSLSFLLSPEEGGYISKGFDGKLYPATYENLNKILGENFDCEAAVKAMFAKSNAFRTSEAKPNILLCVYAYNQQHR